MRIICSAAAPPDGLFVTDSKDEFADEHRVLIDDLGLSVVSLAPHSLTSILGKMIHFISDGC